LSWRHYTGPDWGAGDSEVKQISAIVAVLGWIMAGSAAGDDWPSFANDIGGSQYSALSQLDPSNVAGLEQAWVHRSGDFLDTGARGTSLQVTPIHANGLIYYCTPMNRVFALDPVSGQERWVFDPHTPATPGGKPVTDKERGAGTCRGVAYWSGDDDDSAQACARRIFKSDRYGQVYAIDADTGASCQDFGAAEGHPGFVSQYDYEGYGEGHRGASSPPLVIGDLVVAASGANDGLTNAADGVVRGFDVRSGALLWTFNPIPEGLRDQTGAANVWSIMSGDADNGLIFLPTTSPSTDYYGGGRLFDLPLSDAVVALKAETGEVAWSFQTVRHDLFDYDLPGHALLVNIEKDGQRRDVAIQQTKMGYLYVFDRLTGEPIFPIEEMPVPASDLPDEIAAPTQPISPGIAAFSSQVLERENLFGLTPFDRGWCQARFDELRYEGQYTPPSAQGSILFPSALGGGNWGGAAFDQERNLLIIKAENLATRLKLLPQAEEGPPMDYLTRPLQGTPYRTEGEVFLSPLGIPCTPPPWGTLAAIDMDSGKLRWQIPLGQVKRFGITVPESFGWGAPNIGGPIITGGGLIFVGATFDEKFRALDVETGKELWQTELPITATAMPMTYQGADGRQYVVIAAGGTARAGTGASDYLIAFALPE
jgi:quinoprotein glucose dehydrogenase